MINRRYAGRVSVVTGYMVKLVEALEEAVVCDIARVGEVNEDIVHGTASSVQE